jgi:hypothetical protein
MRIRPPGSVNMEVRKMANAALSSSQGLNTQPESVQGPNAFPVFIRELRTFLDGPLQKLNDGIEAGKATIGDFLATWAPAGKQMLKVIALIPHMGEPQGRELLRRLAFVASSIEYHVQREGDTPGTGLGKLSGMEDALIGLGRAGHHAPRDSHDTLWRWNTGPDRIRFTGDVQENVFAHGVIETDRLHTDSCAAIRPVCWGTDKLATAQTVESLRRAEGNTRRLCDAYVAFRSPREDWSLKPAFFMKRLRTYLLPYPVGGKTLTGPNAANIASQLSLDFLTGFGDRAYYDRWAAERMKHMTIEDAFQVEMDALQAEPLAAVVLRELDLADELFAILDDYQVAAHIVGQSHDVRSAVTAFARFAREQIRLSGIHWSLIKSHLIKPGQELSAEEAARMPVKHNAGTGQTGHEDTYGIFKMRHDHPVISKLVRAVALLPEGESNENGL